jgi:hypothetical protein
MPNSTINLGPPPTPTELSSKEVKALMKRHSWFRPRSATTKSNKRPRRLRIPADQTDSAQSSDSEVSLVGKEYLGKVTTVTGLTGIDTEDGNIDGPTTPASSVATSDACINGPTSTIYLLWDIFFYNDLYTLEYLRKVTTVTGLTGIATGDNNIDGPNTSASSVATSDARINGPTSTIYLLLDIFCIMIYTL